jgi:signal transduction histidine kinase
MTTFAADHDTDRQLEELNERTRTAWEDYRASIRELAGSEYEQTELISWERLQQALNEVADERQRVVATTPAGRSDDPH